MPTGYTAALYEGQTQTFPEFAMSCARAFGALITMRDDPIGTPIPEEIKPDTSYYEEKIRNAETEIVEAKAWSAATAERLAIEAYEAQVARYEQALAEAQARAERYQLMLAEVEAWEPPTEEHQGLKKFMVEQLTSSIDFDCDTSYRSRPARQSGEEYREAVVAKARSEIAYSTRHIAEEIDRATDRTNWVRALRASLNERSESSSVGGAEEGMLG
jgi:hypothetical protein